MILLCLYLCKQYANFDSNRNDWEENKKKEKRKNMKKGISWKQLGEGKSQTRFWKRTIGEGGSRRRSLRNRKSVCDNFMLPGC